jgi:hypothetical protein
MSVKPYRSGRSLEAETFRRSPHATLVLAAFEQPDGWLREKPAAGWMVAGDAAKDWAGMIGRGKFRGRVGASGRNKKSASLW